MKRKIRTVLLFTIAIAALFGIWYFRDVGETTRMWCMVALQWTVICLAVVLELTEAKSDEKSE